MGSPKNAGMKNIPAGLRKNKPYNQVYSTINGQYESDKTHPQHTLKQLSNPEDNMLRNSAQCSTQYYSGALFLYKINNSKKIGEYFGDIVNSVKGRKAEQTAVVAENSVILQIGGLQYYQIFKNIIYQINYVYQILDLTFKGYTRKVLLEISLNSERYDFKQDQQIYPQDIESSGLFILKEGEVVILKDKKKLKYLKKGSIFGHEDMFYKSRKFEAVSDSNKTVVFEIGKQKVSNYYFLQQVKKMGEPEFQNLMKIYNNEMGSHQQSVQISSSPLKKSSPKIRVSSAITAPNFSNTNITVNSVAVTNTNHNFLSITQGSAQRSSQKKLSNSNLHLAIPNLSKKQTNILNRFVSNRGSVSLITPELLDVQINDKELIKMKLEQQKNQRYMENSSSVQKIHHRPYTANSYKSSNTYQNIKKLNLTNIQNLRRKSMKRDSVINNGGNGGGSQGGMGQITSGRGSASQNVQGRTQVERFAMMKEMDVFNDEDYSEEHINDIQNIKSLNKIVFEGNKSKIIPATKKNRYDSDFMGSGNNPYGNSNFAKSPSSSQKIFCFSPHNQINQYESSENYKTPPKYKDRNQGGTKKSSNFKISQSQNFFPSSNLKNSQAKLSQHQLSSQQYLQPGFSDINNQQWKINQQRSMSSFTKSLLAKHENPYQQYYMLHAQNRKLFNYKDVFEEEEMDFEQQQQEIYNQQLQKASQRSHQYDEIQQDNQFQIKQHPLSISINNSEYKSSQGSASGSPQNRHQRSGSYGYEEDYAEFSKSRIREMEQKKNQPKDKPQDELKIRLDR